MSGKLTVASQQAIMMSQLACPTLVFHKTCFFSTLGTEIAHIPFTPSRENKYLLVQISGRQQQRNKTVTISTSISLFLNN